jgi:Asp/Glu/hydantoin racemase
MITLEFHDPTGITDVTQRHALRPPSLNGKRIGFLTNEQWQAYYALPLLKEMINQDFPDAEVLAIDAFPKGNEAIGTDEAARRLKKSGVDAVIIGNAA